MAKKKLEPVQKKPVKSLPVTDDAGPQRIELWASPADPKSYGHCNKCGKVAHRKLVQRSDIHAERLCAECV